MKNNSKTVTYGSLFFNSQLMSDIKENLLKKGFIFVESNIFRKLFDEKVAMTPQVILAFCESWNNLVTDNYMSDNGNYRKRKHATFMIKDRVCNKNAYIPHYQTIDHNTLNGGIERYFTEIDEIIANPIFNGLLAFAYTAFDGSKNKNWFMEAHQFRIESNQTMRGKPTPEGIHRDGVDFVLMAMVKRQNMQGGVTTIYDLEQNKLNSFELDKFLDIALVDDHRVFHGVSEITPSNNDMLAYRDVLVITFKEMKQ
ncbi:2OG-Fe dioxygenase family protein [Faucicola atlantae]|uniref:2OG-Fe dioxygenase family protein n=1 Tax=Faucicola atlantae TaxID=34059 RepID=UPI0025AF4F40|nr:2OG-Fe dioxygenase family protein [Moraxella atlantae]